MRRSFAFLLSIYDIKLASQSISLQLDAGPCISTTQTASPYAMMAVCHSDEMLGGKLSIMRQSLCHFSLLAGKNIIAKSLKVWQSAFKTATVHIESSLENYSGKISTVHSFLSERPTATITFNSHSAAYSHCSGSCVWCLTTLMTKGNELDVSNNKIIFINNRFFLASLRISRYQQCEKTLYVN